MDVAGYTRELKQHVGGTAFANLSESCSFVGCGKALAREILADVPYLPSGREKRYLIKDVARALKSKEVY